jgi:hypothetical protein
MKVMNHSLNFERMYLFFFDFLTKNANLRLSLSSSHIDPRHITKILITSSPWEALSWPKPKIYAYTTPKFTYIYMANDITRSQSRSQRNVSNKSTFLSGSQHFE